MLSSTTTQTGQLDGNASTSTTYAIGFPLADAAHIQAIKKLKSTGAETVLTSNEFTFTPSITEGRITGGTATTNPAIPATYTIRFRRVTPRTQTFDVVQGSRFSAEALESALDKMTMILQEIERDYLAADVAIDARLDALE